MREAGVPDMAVAQWHGHDEAVLMRAYSHPSEQSLREARVVAGVKPGRSDDPC